MQRKYRNELDGFKAKIRKEENEKNVVGGEKWMSNKRERISGEIIAKEKEKTKAENEEESAE